VPRPGDANGGIDVKKRFYVFFYILVTFFYVLNVFFIFQTFFVTFNFHLNVFLHLRTVECTWFQWACAVPPRSQSSVFWYSSPARLSAYSGTGDAISQSSSSSLHFSTYSQVRYDTIRDAILTCARKPTWVSLIYRTEPTTKKCKNRKKLKVENRYAQK